MLSKRQPGSIGKVDKQDLEDIALLLGNRFSLDSRHVEWHHMWARGRGRTERGVAAGRSGRGGSGDVILWAKEDIIELDIGVGDASYTQFDNVSDSRVSGTHPDAETRAQGGAAERAA